MGNWKLSAVGDRTRALASPNKAFSRFGHLSAGRGAVLNEESFHATLTIERRRAERSGKPFALLLLDSHATHKNGNGAIIIDRLTSVVSDATRETDIIGWYEDREILGVIFTEINPEGKSPVSEVLYSKIVTALRNNLDPKLASSLVITVHLFPESWDNNRPGRVADAKLYPELSPRRSKKRFPTAVKRGIDVVGSGILLLVLSPVLALIALAVKMTSRGPVIFQQERLGQFARRFKCLKFRTMHVDNSPKIHREFVRSFIAGKKGLGKKNRGEPAVYKITDDPRVTAIGRFLRKTSLDELPQLWNVLRGEMSLVGPRPPVPYEFEVYDYWHRRRVLEVKPGVTGLWQVGGRSRTTFDDMVRLDLRYAQSWNLWLDLKILLSTPRAVLRGDGAC